MADGHRLAAEHLAGRADGQHPGAEHSAAEHSAAEHSAAEHSAAEHRPVEHSAAEHRPVEHTAIPADEREAGFRPVQCERCGAVALVAKFSPQHTSVQWTTESVRACAEFSARAAAGEQTALIDTCASLRDSIDRAVRQGRLKESPP